MGTSSAVVGQDVDLSTREVVSHPSDGARARAIVLIDGMRITIEVQPWRLYLTSSLDRALERMGYRVL